MIKQPRFYRDSKNAIRSSIFSRAMFLFVFVFALFASAVAQPIDYNLPENWMCHPVLKSTDVARQQKLTLIVKNPDMSTKDSINYSRDTLVDIFYIYPTIDMDTKHLGNTSMDSIDKRTAQFVYCEQVGIYAQFGRVFAPYYRQAKISVFITKSTPDSVQKHNEEYLEKAYNDIDSAFSNYLKYYNKGRKIILMGHSQGSDLMRFLLRKRFDNDSILTSQLVVALSGGEPNYAEKGSRTGGSLEHIKTLGSTLESGCIVSWRTWKSGTQGAQLDSASFFYNPYFADSNLIYQTYDQNIPRKHEDSNYDLGYRVKKRVTRYITLSPDSSEYWGFDDMFNAQFLDDSLKRPGCTYLMIETNPIANDLRKIPNPRTPIPDPIFPSIPIPETSYFTSPPSPNNNYHCWDMQFVQGDLLKLIPELIKVTHPTTSVPKVSDFEKILIYPNPTNGIVHVGISNQKIKSIKLYNLRGDFIEEFFKNDFSVSNLTNGIYFINIQTDKSTFVNKLVKQ